MQILEEPARYKSFGIASPIRKAWSDVLIKVLSFTSLGFTFGLVCYLKEVKV